MAKRAGLGKGIDAMFGEYDSDVSRETSINVNLIDTYAGQPRTVFEQTALEELAESIREHGVIEPLIVREKGNRYEIIAGERRYRAARIAGLKEVPAVVRDYADEERYMIALLENIQRKDLTSIEEAEAYQQILDAKGCTHDELAKEVSKSRTAVTNKLRLLKLTEEVRDMIKDGSLSEAQGRTIIPLEEARQIEVAKLAVSKQLSVRVLEKLVKDEIEGKKKKEAQEEEKKYNKNANLEEQRALVYLDYERKLGGALGTKVGIKRKTERSGKIEIDYYSLEEFEKIVEIITGRRE